MFDPFIELLATDGYIIFNKYLAKVVGRDGSLLLGELISKYRYYRNTNKLTPDGYFYSTVEDIEDNTTLNDYEQRKIIKQLKEKSLLSVERRKDGLRFFKVNIENLKQLFSETENFGSLNFKEPEIKNLKINNNKNNNKLEVVEEKNPTDSTKTTKHNSKNRNISQIKQYVLDNKEIINQKFTEIGKPQLLDVLVNQLDKMNNNMSYRQLKELSIEELELVNQVVLAFRRNNILEYKDIQEMFRLITSVNYDTPETCVTLIEQIQQRNLVKEKGIRYY